MMYTQQKFDQFVERTTELAVLEGPNYTPLEYFGVFKASAPTFKHPTVDFAAIWLVAQGEKMCAVGSREYPFIPGNVVVMFYPTAVESQIVSASPEAPLLLAVVAIDLVRLADVLLRLDRIEGAAVKPVKPDASGVFSIPLTDSLLDSILRLLDVANKPTDAAMLGDSILDEIYYRLLQDVRGGELRYLLQQRGEIQRISKAVEYIHQNIDQPVSVEHLAELVHMGQTTFYENFKSVMHLSPLQYAKSVKLQAAQTLIQNGKKANEAAYLVGYNSPAQFSREYKRHFGFVPSETLSA